MLPFYILQVSFEFISFLFFFWSISVKKDSIRCAQLCKYCNNANASSRPMKCLWIHKRVRSGSSCLQITLENGLKIGNFGKNQENSHFCFEKKCIQTLVDPTIKLSQIEHSLFPLQQIKLNELVLLGQLDVQFGINRDSPKENDKLSVLGLNQN